MAASVAFASNRQTRVEPLHTTQPNNNESESAQASPNHQSADPRSSNALSPRQSDAILNLASTVGSLDSSPKNASRTQTLSPALRAYDDTDFTVSMSSYSRWDDWGYPLDDDDDTDNDNTVNLDPITVTTPGDSSGDGGGTAPVEGAGGGAPPVDNSGSNGGDGSAPVQGSSPGRSTTGTLTIADDVRVDKSDKTEAGFLRNWENQKDSRVGTSDNGAVPLGEDRTAQRLNPNLLITGHGAYIHSGGQVFWVEPTADHYLAISYRDGNLNISSASTRAL